jgi:hypothetical protein
MREQNIFLCQPPTKEKKSKILSTLLPKYMRFLPIATIQSQTVSLFRALVACPLEKLTPGIEMNSKLHRQMRENFR